jgi:hypothetical protein
VRASLKGVSSLTVKENYLRGLLQRGYLRFK